MLHLTTLLNVPYVEPDLGFDLSPDGSQIAFSWNRTGRWEIYVLSLSEPGTPRQVSSGPGGKFNPRWSPDGRSLAYVLDLDGGENYDLYRYDLATGQQINLTPDTPHALGPNFAWSPDGSQIAIPSDQSGRFDTYVLPASGGPPRCVLRVPFPDWEVRWSPDGRHLAVVVEAQAQDYWTYIVPLERARAAPLEADSAPVISLAGQPVSARDARWSPDGQRLAFASNVSGRYQIGLYELASGQIEWLTQDEADMEQPAWSPDGKRIACVAGHGPLTGLLVADLERGSQTQFRVAPGVHHHPTFTPDGRQLITVFDNPAQPSDLWLCQADSGDCRQLTRSLPPELETAAFAMPEEVRYAGLDGRPVPALLYRPQSTPEPPPAVIYIHGGPNWLSQVTWDPLVQHMVSRGWLVLAPNYRGSTGYGRDWQLGSRFDLGGIDTQDVVAGADYLVREGLADPQRIAVTGRSWGGYLTMTCLTQYPHRWAGGSAVVPFLNWFTSHKNSREDLRHWDRENFGDPESNRDLWYDRSPYFHLDRIQAPVQLISGAHDVRCPASESLQARDKLEALGKRCELWLYQDEGHSFLKRENRIDSEERRVAFLARILERER